MHHNCPTPFFSAIAGVVATLVGGLIPTASAADAPTTAPTTNPSYVIPEIPTDRIRFQGTGYPIIPPDIEKLIADRQDVWDRMANDAFQRAMPEVERWEKMGRPFVRVARKPDDLLKGDVPAFPGAEGGGMYSLGGRGGRVFVVTSLADNGPGTFREACEAGGPRIVVFNVAGIIKLERPLQILAPYITIAGQTAPGEGVCVAGHTVHLGTHDIVVRYMRIRRGSTDITNRDDALSGDSIGNLILDHISASWGCDETLSNYRQMYVADPTQPKKREKLPVVNTTIQWYLITETLDAYHHGFGGTWGGMNTLFHHNMFACCTGRNASIGMGYDFNFVNNVLFNWRHRTLDGGDQATSRVNVINNYYKPGPETQGQLRYRIAKPDHGGQWYVAGNIIHDNEAVTKDNWNGGIQQAGRMVRVNEPFQMAAITLQPAQEAFDSVMSFVGATLPAHDSVDQRAVRQARTGEVQYKEGNGIITDPEQVGGYPKYTGTPRPDVKADGIPESWKKKYNLDLNDASVASKDTDGDGYTNVEEYLNGTDPTQKVDYKDLKNNVSSLVPGTVSN